MKDACNFRWLATAFTIALGAAAGGEALAGGTVNTGYFGGVAIEGYDSVAYFTESKAVKGSQEFQHDFLGEIWLFSSSENRDLFMSDPVSYAPQYGGFCAGEMLYADVSTGITTNINPESWRIIDGKLYLFYNDGTAAFFAENAEEFVEKADQKWPTVSDRLLSQ
ncbi:MAG: hypothetical protein GY952_04815 [Rhodobacteraceae bacterium]|nr:hypothetical protein [Paracoccaceae bacterium]